MYPEYTFDREYFFHDVYGRLSMLNLTVQQLCKKSGISESTFYRLMAGTSAIKLAWYLTACYLLSMNPGQYIYTADEKSITK